MLPYVWMLCGSFAFALMAALAHALANDLDWRVIALFRSALAFTFALALALAAGARLVVWRPRTLWLRSLAGSASLLGTFFAYARLPVSDVLTLTNMFPIWVAFLSWPLLKEAPSGGVWLSALAGISGVALIQQPHLAEGNWAALVALGCSFCTAVAMLGLHRLSHIDTRAIVAHFSAVSACFCAGALVLARQPVSIDAIGGVPLLMLLGIGVAATVGQLCLTKAFASGAPAKVSVVGLTQILFAVLLDLVIWQRPFGALTVLGMVLVVAPTAWLMLMRWR